MANQGAVSPDMQALIDEVAQDRTVMGGAATLMDGLTQRLNNAANNNDMAAVRQVVTDLQAGRTALTDAITRNTPADTGNPAGTPTPGGPGNPPAPPAQGTTRRHP